MSKLVSKVLRDRSMSHFRGNQEEDGKTTTSGSSAEE
jgi:hypothetical protein